MIAGNNTGNGIVALPSNTTKRMNYSTQFSIKWRGASGRPEMERPRSVSAVRVRVSRNTAIEVLRKFAAIGCGDFKTGPAR